MSTQKFLSFEKRMYYPSVVSPTSDAIYVGSTGDFRLADVHAVTPTIVPEGDPVVITLNGLIEEFVSNSTIRVVVGGSATDVAGTTVMSVPITGNGPFDLSGECAASLFTGNTYVKLVFDQGSFNQIKLRTYTLIFTTVPKKDPCGADLFQFDSVQLINANVIRARFTRPPKLTNVNQANDAGKPTNWTITGPQARTVTLASGVSSDTDVVDLYVNSPLIPGTWTVTASDKIISGDTDAFALEPVYQHDFEYVIVKQDPISLGAVNDDCEAGLAKHFNPAYRDKPSWSALLAGLAKGDCFVRDYAIKAKNQFYVSTASGSFLTKRAADRGIAKPERVGFSDAVFSTLVTTVTNSKLTQLSFQEILEIFYGPEAVRATSTTALAEPFVLREGHELEFLVDETESVKYVVSRNDFQTLRRATAEELSAAITRSCEHFSSGAYALPHLDPVTGARRVRIYSGTRGLRSSVRITGGRAQFSLVFPQPIFSATTPVPNWVVTVQPGGYLRFQPDSAALYDLRYVVPGDYVVILGQEFAAENRGSWPITAVNYSYSGATLDQWFEVYNPAGVAMDSTPQCDEADSLMFFTPRRATVYDNPGYAVVSQTLGSALVSMPATTQAVARSSGTAAYLKSRTPVSVSSVVRLPDGTTTITTATPHGITAGQHIILDLLRPDQPMLSLTPGVPSGALNVSEEAIGSTALSLHTVASRDTSEARALHIALRDGDGDAVFIGGQTEDGAGAFTTQKRIDAFRVTETVITAQAKQNRYRWRGTAFSTPSFRPIGCAASLLDYPLVLNDILITGGYELSPWNDYTDARLATVSFRARKTPIREQVLTYSQLHNTQGIKAALQFYLTAQPVSGDILTIKTTGTTRTYGFGTGGNVTVAIGGSTAATMTNLAAAINGDGSADWNAVYSTAVPPNQAPSPGTVIIYEKTTTGTKSSLRTFGTFATQSSAKVVEYANDASFSPDYSSHIAATAATTDPGSGRAGFRKPVAKLVDLEYHYAIAEAKYGRWSASGPSWTDVTGSVLFHTLISAGTVPTAHANAAQATITTPSRVVITGGTTSTGVTDSGLNTASNQVLIYNQQTEAWSSGVALKQARMQHAMAALPNNKALVIGGRVPATYTCEELTGFTFWHFDESPAAATTFAGPVTVTRAGNPRPPGKIGWGVRCVATMPSTGGAAQTTLNSELLGSYTISGWMTSATGCVFRNGVTGAPGSVADSTLIAFGVDPSDDKFFIRWMYSTGPSTITLKTTTATRAALMPVAHDNAYPRYYHFAITKSVNGSNATFTLYVNGEFVETWTDSKPVNGGSTTWRFGDADASITGYSGSIDHFAYKASTVLSADEVRAVFRSQVGVAYDSPKNIDASPVGRVLETCEIVDGAGFVAKTGSMATARFAHGTVVLPDGRVIVAGGVGYNPTSDAFPGSTAQRGLELKSVEIYDPRTGYWSPLPDMSEPHSYCVLSYVAGKVYCFGGFTSRLVECLDLKTMTWGPVAGPVRAWAATTAYVVGDWVRTPEGHKYIATVAGTSGATAPSGFTTFVDGGVTWAYDSGPAGLQETRARAAGALSGASPVLMGGSTTQPGLQSKTTNADYSLDIAALTARAGGLNDTHLVLSATATTLVVSTPEHAHYTSATVTPGQIIPVTAIASVVGEARGAFVFDPIAGFGINAVTGTTGQRLDAGKNYVSLKLGTGEAAAFPDKPGFIVLAYGRSNQAVVPYLGRVNNNELRLDAGYRFETTIPSGSEARYVFQNSPYVPDPISGIGAFYLTAAPAGRVAAESFIRDCSSAGIDLDISIRYPGDRGLGGEGRPTRGARKISDIAAVFGGDNLDSELEARRGY